MDYLDLINIRSLTGNGYKKLEGSYFLERDVREYFREEIYLSENLKSIVYVVSNTRKRSRRVVIEEVMKSLLTLENRYEAKIRIFIKEEGRVYSFGEYIAATPLEPTPYGPNMKAYESELRSQKEGPLTRSIKVKIFSELIKFILRDKDLRGLLKHFLI